jgi:hypothetical protein
LSLVGSSSIDSFLQESIITEWKKRVKQKSAREYFSGSLRGLGSSVIIDIGVGEGKCLEQADPLLLPAKE